MFLFKRKKLIIESFVPEDYSCAYSYSPPVLAKNEIPSWWKNVPASKFDWHSFSAVRRVKSCIGIRNTLVSGIIIPMWADLAIKCNKENWRYLFADQQGDVTCHNSVQVPGFYEDHYIFKITNPWVMRTPEKNLKLLYQQPIYHNTTALPYLQPSAIMETFRGVFVTSFFIFVKKTEEDTEFIIPESSPVLHIVPFSDKEIELKNHIVPYSEYIKIRNSSLAASFISGGLKHLKRIKVQNASK